jgi:hypothetical protein
VGFGQIGLVVLGLLRSRARSLRGGGCLVVRRIVVLPVGSDIGVSLAVVGGGNVGAGAGQAEPAQFEGPGFADAAKTGGRRRGRYPYGPRAGAALPVGTR